MDYHYEALDEKKFQKLCQALIVAQYPNAQCLPVGQPDGGRDAIVGHIDSDQSGFTVFQVKFSNYPGQKEERDAINAVIKSEKSKVENLIQRGATEYVFVTNVRGSSHLDCGSIDQVNQTLANEFAIRSCVWWRDDLDRRLDNLVDIKWSYPEILKATDLLPKLVPILVDEEMGDFCLALKSYLAMQYEKDQDVKFKEVELRQSLTEMYVDVPIGIKRQTSEHKHRHRANADDRSEIEAYIGQLELKEDFEIDQEISSDQSLLAGAFLLQIPQKNGVSRFVIEGAPGQGKSTVTQFLCQMNRLRLLKKDNDLVKIKDLHKTGMVRTPFRIDMQLYATWVSGGDPFENSEDWTTRQNTTISLESFLARQVEVLSGGMRISVNDLIKFFAVSNSVIVLDGFDEVADIKIRERLVEEICKASARFDVFAKSMQIIVTSRPAAFANSPGFPENDWIYLKLEDLKVKNIEAYKDKWIVVQQFDEEEKNQISSILKEKLKQQHLRDLARNPMQLSILLRLIHTKGVALPEKRTMLYKEYMELFFNREAEKSKIVRDNRELLLLIHGVLAWILHTQVEENLGTGKISRAALLEEVSNYLETEEYDQFNLEELLRGTVERVGALVSREEGMFEFEVQPLREYFAAYHLYVTAPYSPAGNPQKGTKSDRFDALARNFYWTNVTRFYCGFYDKGELDSLVTGITSLAEEEKYALIDKPRELAMMLLSDQVFTQEPKAMKRLVEFITGGDGFQRFNYLESFDRRNVSLSTEAGGNFLFKNCEEMLRTEEDPSRCRVLREVLAQSNDHENLKSIWETRRLNRNLTTSELFREAEEFGIANYFSLYEIANLVGEDVDCHLRWLASMMRYKAINETEGLHLAAKQALFAGNLEFPLNWFYSNHSATAFEVLTELLRPIAFTRLFGEPGKSISIHTILGRGYRSKYERRFEPIRKSCERGERDSLDSFKKFVYKLLLVTNVDEWQNTLRPWNALVDRGLDEANDNFLILQIAIVATASKTNPDAGKWDRRGFHATEGLVNRLFFARHKCDDIDWWRSQLPDNNSQTVILYLAILLFWGHPETIASLIASFTPIIDSLSSRDWRRLGKLVRQLFEASDGQIPTIPETWFQTSTELSLRTASILLERVDDRKTAGRLSRTYFSDYDGDDPEILTSVAKFELNGRDAESVDWDHIKNLSMRAQHLDISKPFPLGMSFMTMIPELVAKDVLENYELHSEQFVASCKNTYATIVAKNASTVSKLARDEGWFE